MPTCLEPRPSAEDRRHKSQDLAQRYGTITPGSSREEELVGEHPPLVRNIVGRLAMKVPSQVDVHDISAATKWDEESRSLPVLDFERKLDFGVLWSDLADFCAAMSKNIVCL